MAGVKQGRTVSPYLFNLYLDPMIRMVERMAGYRWGEEDEDQVSIFAYADDITLISSNIAGLQAMLNVCETYFNDVGLRINIGKCATYGINKAPKTKDHQVTYGGNPLPVLLPGNFYKYLSRHVNPDWRDRSPLTDACQKLGRAGLKLYQTVELFSSNQSN